MWFALTAHRTERSRKEKKKEFSAQQYEVILTADSQQDLERKLKASMEKYPKQINKYLHAGIKIVEADNPAQAKSRAVREHKYFDHRGQYSLF
jgi:hypothetical protein